MGDTGNAETGQVTAAAAEIYEDFFLPALFEQWTSPVLDAAGVGAGDDVVDVGCGTGVLARAAARRLGGTGSVTGVDVNEGMLAVARRSPERVTWRAGDAEDLPFSDDSFDRAVCQFVLMFVPDPAQVVDEMGRVVRPGGSVTVATWADLAESPGYAAMVDLLRRLFGNEAADALTAPFVLGTHERVRSLFGEGFDDVQVVRREGRARFDSLEDWVHTDVRGWTLADMIDDDQFERLLAEATSDLAGFVGADGRVEFDAPALIAHATWRGGR